MHTHTYTYTYTLKSEICIHLSKLDYSYQLISIVYFFLKSVTDADTLIYIGNELIAYLGEM